MKIGSLPPPRGEPYYYITPEEGGAADIEAMWLAEDFRAKATGGSVRIQVTFRIDEDDDYADPDDEMGLSEAGYQHLIRYIPGYDINVVQIDDDEDD